MYVGMIGTRSLKRLLKSFHGYYQDLFIKNHCTKKYGGKITDN